MKPARGTDQWALFVAVALVCVVSIVVLRQYAAPIVLGSAVMLALWLWRRPSVEETDSMTRSLELAAQELAEVADQYDYFCSSSSPDALADRTLARPALLDPQCGDPAIEQFLFLYQTSRRFLDRLPARVSACESLQELDRLLTVVDERTLALQEAWSRAYVAAARLGPDYRRLPPPSGEAQPGQD